MTEIAPPIEIDDGLLLNQLPKWTPDAAVRRKILVDNPARLYGSGPEGLRAVAARHDRAGDGFRATIDLAAAVIASRWISTGPRCLP